MIYFLKTCYNYMNLLYTLYLYYLNFNKTKKHDLLMINNLKEKINNCGSISIKFTQWICPRLDVMYSKNNEKPEWLNIIEKLYENCDIHPEEYTLSLYKEMFNEDFNEKYKLLNVLGSGSIGQVYLIEDIPISEYKVKKKYVLKVVHPNIEYEINFFKYFYKIFSYIPFINNKIKEYLPFDIYTFIEQFKQQIDFINEGNNLLQFKENYKDNEFIIIPDLIRSSKSILIMSYEKGVSFNELETNEYQKSKLALLLSSFVMNNQTIYNFWHGDIHKGNWRCRIENNKMKLLFYDFGFCWRVPSNRKHEINLAVDIIENSDNATIDQNIQLIKHLLIYDNSKDINIDIHIRKYILDNNIKPSHNISKIMKIGIDISNKHGYKLDPILIQVIIILIQLEKIYIEYDILNENRSSYSYYKEIYLDYINLYNTYNIFTEFKNYKIDKFNEININCDNLFDTINMPNEIKKLALEKYK